MEHGRMDRVLKGEMRRLVRSIPGRKNRAKKSSDMGNVG